MLRSKFVEKSCLWVTISKIVQRIEISTENCIFQFPIRMHECWYKLIFFWEKNISQIKLLTPKIKRYVIFKTSTLIWSTIWFMIKYQLSQSSAKWALLINSVFENHSIILTLKFWSNLQLFLTTMVVICRQKMATTTDNNSIIYHYILRKKR